MAGALATAHRQAQLKIRARTLRELNALWPGIDWSNLDRAFPVWVELVSGIVARNRADSTTLAAAYLKATRKAAGILGAAPISLAGPVPDSQLFTSLWVTAGLGVQAAGADPALANTAVAKAFVKSSGAVTRLVLAGGRETITETTRADPRAVGFERVTSPNCCDFCSDLAAMAETNPALATDFEAHDHCGCSAEPVYG